MARGESVHFVRSTQVRPEDVLSVGGVSLWSNSDETFRKIDRLCGEGASNLFAEPTVKQREGEDRLVVTWFGSHDDEPKALDAVDRGLRARVEGNFETRVANLRSALDDPDIGETVAAMLNVADEACLFAVGENAVLTNWGMLPPAAQASEAAFIEHTRTTIGPYLSQGISPRIPGHSWRFSASAERVGQSPPRINRVIPETVVSVGTAPTRERRGMAIWPAALLTAIFMAGLVYVAWPGNLVYPSAEAQADDPAVMMAELEKTNTSLESRIATLRTELGKDPCAADASLLGIMLPGEPGNPDPPAASLVAPGGAATSGRALLTALDSATVLVLAPVADGLNTGSGFFVTPTDILTNRHVVEGSSQQVYVASKTLGQAVPAQVVAVSEGSEAGGPDFALLRIASPAGEATPLPLSPNVERLDNVVAGGFPSFVMQLDETYRSILSGDTAGIDDLSLVVTRGTVMSLPHVGNTRIITHSASISPGNSGGPLVDACGRAVGVNTFISYDGESAQRLNFSLDANSAAEFLDRNGVTPTVDAGQCLPARDLPPVAEPQPEPEQPDERAAVPDEPGNDGSKAMTEEATKTSLAEAIVAILRPGSEGHGSRFVGTGFFVSPDNVLSIRIPDARVGDAFRVVPKGFDGELKARMVARSNHDDAPLGLLRVEMPPSLRISPLRFGKEQYVGQKIREFLYSGADSVNEIFSNLRVGESVIKDEAGNFNPNIGGNGLNGWTGPIFNKCGGVFGLFSGYYSQARKSYIYRSIQQITGFLNSAGVTPVVDTAACVDDTETARNPE